MIHIISHAPFSAMNSNTQDSVPTNQYSRYMYPKALVYSIYTLLKYVLLQHKASNDEAIQMNSTVIKGRYTIHDVVFLLSYRENSSPI